MSNTPYFLATDIEAGGLDELLENGQMGQTYYPIFEIALIFLDKELNEIGEPLQLSIHQTEEAIATSSEWSLKHLEENGVLDKSRKSPYSLNRCDSLIEDYLKSFGITPFDKSKPSGIRLLGNSIKYDMNFISAQMPLFSKYLHYRLPDISAIGEFAKAWRPEIEQKAKSAKTYKHEAMPDIRESIAELKIYKNALFP